MDKIKNKMTDIKNMSRLSKGYRRQICNGMMRFCVIYVLLILTMNGCTWFEAKSEKTAEQLIQEGMTAYQQEDYRDAIEAFQKIKDWYPFSKYAILAELKIADAHFQLEQYPEAIYEYESFEQLHPRNEAIPYVIFQIAMSHFNQMDTIDRDQTSARNALNTFNRLKKQYPNDPYARRADEYIQKCRESLAGHEFYVGEFYFRTKHYKSALGRFQYLLATYPDIQIYKDKATHYIQQCQQILSQKQTANNLP